MRDRKGEESEMKEEKLEEERLGVGKDGKRRRWRNPVCETERRMR